MRFERAEYFLLFTLVILATLSVCIAQIKNINVEFSDYIFRGAIAATMIAIGQFYRLLRPRPSIAASATAIGIFLMAGQTMRLFNYTLLPYNFSSVDVQLAWIDAQFGFVWSSYAQHMSQYPIISDLLRKVYISSYIQIVFLILLLGIFEKTSTIMRFLTANIMGGLVTVFLWFLFPSSTPSAFQTISPEILARLDLVLGAEYGRWLAELGQQGVSIIKPSSLGGIVGFPSFHTVMALLIVWYAKEIRYAFFGFLTLNTLMMPATLLHGAHNLVDIFGGFAVAALAIWLSESNAKSIAQLDRQATRIPLQYAFLSHMKNISIKACKPKTTLAKSDALIN